MQLRPGAAKKKKRSLLGQLIKFNYEIQIRGNNNTKFFNLSTIPWLPKIIYLFLGNIH